MRSEIDTGSRRAMNTSHAIARCTLSCLLAVAAPSPVLAKDDIEFVQEHLPEVAMDNRYATLPLWSNPAIGEARPGLEFQSAFASTGAGNLRISGPMLSIGGRWHFSPRWQLRAFAFYDALQLRATSEDRDLQTTFAPNTPIIRPIAARFSGLDGTATDLGFGVNVSRRVDDGVLGTHDWIGGVLWQNVELKDYRFDYVVQSGPQAGLSGTIDFDAQYDHVVPFVGLAIPRDYGNWSTNAHALIAYPVPRRGIVGHITGPGFDISGDTADVGNGKHFGDPSVTFGYTITYRPAHLSLDLGALATQALLESRVHRGIDSNVLLSFSLAL
jgi:hypothetical protein